MDHAALLQEIMQYLEQMIEQCSSLPAFYPPGVTFQQLVQPIDLLVPSWYPLERGPLTYLDLARTEHLHWAGYDWETEEWYGRVHEERFVKYPFQPLVVLGNSGTGKSWFLRARCLQVAHQQLERLRYDEQSFSTLTVPLFFPARAVAEALAQEKVEPPSLISVLLSLLQHQMGFSSAARVWVQPILGTRRTVLLLDDLHQVLPEHQARLLEALRTFCLDSRGASVVIVTTHPAGYTGRVFPLKDTPLACFLWNQVRGFVLSWFALSPGRGQQVLQTLHADPFLQTLTRLPMFLPWLCHLAASGEPLPARRVDLYEAILRAFGFLEQEPTPPVIEDYLVARRLSCLPFEAMWDQIRPHLWCDSLWENRILLLAGSMQNPTPLLRGILAEEHDAFHWMLLLAGRCLAETEPSRVDPAVVQELTTRLFALHSSVAASSRRQVAAILERIARPMMLTHYVTQVHNPQDEEKFLEAISRMGTMGDTSVIPILLNQLQLQYRSRKERDYGYPERGVLYHTLERIGGWESAQALFTLFHNSPTWTPTWNVNEALARIHAQGVTQELLRLAHNSTVRQIIDVSEIIARRSDGNAVEILLSRLEQEFPQVWALSTWLSVARVTKRGDMERWADTFLEIMSRWATGKDKKLNIFAYGDNWFSIVAELGGPQMEHELQHILLLSVQNSTQNIQDSWRQRGRVNLLLDDKDIEALLGHPSQEVHVCTLNYLNAQDNWEALNCLFYLLVERNVEDFIRLDEKKLAASLDSYSDYTWKLKALQVVSRIRRRQVAEAVLTLAQQEERLEQEAEQTNQAYLEGLLTRSELALYFLSGDLYLTAATMLGMLGDPRGTALAYQRLVLAQKRNEDLEMKAGVKPGSDKAVHVLCRLSHRGDEQALEVLRRCLFEEHPVPQKVAHAWRREFFLGTGPGMEIAVYWYDVWSLVDTEGHTRRLVSQPALEKLIREDDPDELVEELLTLWSDETALSAPLAKKNGVRTITPDTEEETRRSAVYQILAVCAPLLVSKGRKDVLQLRKRLAQLTPGVPQ